MKRFLQVAGLIVLFAAGIMAATTTNPAQAYSTIVQTISSGTGSGQPPCPPASNGQSEACVTSLTFSGVVLGGQASASDIDNGKVTILSYINPNGLALADVKKMTAQGKCRWIGEGTDVPVFTNSGARNGSGPLGKFKDTRRTFVCHTGKGPSGWQKAYDVANGKKEHPCANYIWFGITGPLIKGRVIVVRNAASIKMHLHATAHVVLVAVCGKAEASGFGDVVVSLTDFIRTRGNKQARLQLGGSAVGKAVAKASASISCTVGGTPPTTTVVTTTPGTTTVVTTTTTTTTTTTPKVHTCATSVSNLQKDERTATFSVTCDGPIASATWTFSGNGRTATGTSVTNTFPDSEAGKTATGTVTVLFSDGASAVTKTQGINIPAPPPNGNTGPPPPPAG